MTDDEESVKPHDHAPANRYGETLLYDFAKFLTTLSLLSLGGLLTLREAAQAGDLKIFNIVMVSAGILIAGSLAFLTASTLAHARATETEPPKYLPTLMKAALGALGFGVGGFVMLWIDTLS